MGAGLSSSSAVVVAMAEAAVALNGLDVTPQQFVDLCGEGEWFVGSRGGSAAGSGARGHNYIHNQKVNVMKPTFKPSVVADQGRIRTGAGIRILPGAVADQGRIRTGAGIRIRPLAR